MSYASVATAQSLDAAVIIAPSISGYTARMLSKWHPSTKLVGMSPSISAVRKMMLYWGVTPFQAKRAESTDTLIENSIDILKENGIVKTGDIAVVTAGVVDYAKRHDKESFEKANGMECCECGCCSYICPAKRPLTQYIKSMRKMVLADRKKAAQRGNGK